MPWTPASGGRMASCVPTPTVPRLPLLLLLLAPEVHRLCLESQSRARQKLQRHLGPVQPSPFGPTLNLLALLGVHATEAEGAEGVMAPEKHPGRRQERRGTDKSPSQGVLAPFCSPPTMSEDRNYVLVIFVSPAQDQAPALDCKSLRPGKAGPHPTESHWSARAAGGCSIRGDRLSQ